MSRIAKWIAAAFLGIALAAGGGAAAVDDALAQRKPTPKPRSKKPRGKKPATKKPAERKEVPFKQDLNIVVLQGLDKVTARISTFGGRVGKVVRFRSLEIQIRRCQRNRPENPPERGAFLQIYENDPATGKRKQIFSGWMFSSNPALNGMEHPIYDVWLKDCK